MSGSAPQRPLHVLHVHSGNMFGGVERILETLAAGSKGPASMTSAFALCFDGRLARVLSDRQVEVTHLGEVRTTRPWQVRRARKALRALIARSRPDVVLVHSAWSQALFGAAIGRTGSPLVRWLHAPAPGNRWLELAASRVPLSLLVCNSQYTSDAAGDRFPGVPRRICYAPVPVRSSDGADRTAVRAELRTPADAVVIVLAARMEAWKGQRTLIESLARIRDDARWHCWIAGGAQRASEEVLAKELAGLIERHGLASRVQLLGHRDDTEQMLAAADIYCQPNDGAEPFGLSFVEALGAGLPVVATRLGALPEIVDDSCGILVAPQSPPDVALALSTLLDDAPRRARLARGARARAAVLGDVERRTGELADALEWAMSPARG